MSVPAPAPATLRNGFNFVLSENPADYSLFCVTFTNPPSSGSGDFDIDGNFSVTLTDAAGLPIGCFINEKATNTPVATISFTVGAGGGFDDGTSDSATFDAGTYTANINFNPITGEAAVDVSGVVSETTPTPGVGDITPADLLGEWTMQCAPDNGEASMASCYEFIPPRIFTDVITADLDNDLDGTKDETAYAMGVWRSLATYEAAGSAEGIPSAGIPAEIMAGTLQSLYTTTEAGVTNPFLGFSTQAGWNSATNEMSGDNVVLALAAEGLSYDPTFDDNDSGTCGALDLATVAGRDCLLQYLSHLNREVQNVVPFTVGAVSSALLVPRVDQSAWNDFAQVGTNGTSLIKFDDQFGGPNIPARYAMMDLTIANGAIIANQEDNDLYTSGVDTCEVFHKTVISFTPSTTDPAAMVGWFTISEGDTCDPTRAFTATFKVIFTPFVDAATLTPADMVGEYITACKPEARGGPLESTTTNLVLTDLGSTAGAAVTEFRYGMASCQGAPVSMVNMDATLTPLFDRPTAWGGNAAVTEIVLDGQTITLLDSLLVDQYNLESAYGFSDWVLEVAKAIPPGIGYDGTSEPTAFNELFYTDGNGVLYTGIKDQTSVFGIANDVKPEFVPVAASTLNVAALAGRTFTQMCMDETRVEYNALSRSQSFSFAAGTITVVETYHSDSACGFASRTVEDRQIMPLVDNAIAAQPFTNRGFASPMTVNTDVGYSHTVSVYDATAAAGMNAANGAAGAFGINTWADTDRDVAVGTTDFNGTDPGPFEFSVSAWLEGAFLFLAVPESGVPVNVEGYPIVFRNDDPLFEVDTDLLITDLNGTWLTGCQDKIGSSAYDQIVITGGSGTGTSWTFASSDCSGVGTPATNSFTIDSIDGPMDLGGGGPAFQVTMTDPDGLQCGILQLFADQLRGSFQLESLGNSNSTCEAGEYPAELDMADEPLARNITPVTATTFPIASFSGTCRDYGSNDEMEFIQIIGDMVVVEAVKFLSTGGICVDTTESEQWVAALAFGADDVSTNRGTATRVVVTDPFSGLTMETLLHLEGNFRLFTGDEEGTLDGSGYPTALSDKPIERNF